MEEIPPKRLPLSDEERAKFIDHLKRAGVGGRDFRDDSLVGVHMAPETPYLIIPMTERARASAYSEAVRNGNMEAEDALRLHYSSGDIDFMIVYKPEEANMIYGTDDDWRIIARAFGWIYEDDESVPSRG